MCLYCIPGLSHPTRTKNHVVESTQIQWPRQQWVILSDSPEAQTVAAYTTQHVPAEVPSGNPALSYQTNLVSPMFRNTWIPVNSAVTASCYLCLFLLSHPRIRKSCLCDVQRLKPLPSHLILALFSDELVLPQDHRLLKTNGNAPCSASL